MTLYRVVKTLEIKGKHVKRGDFLRDNVLRSEHIEKLLAIGALAELSAPPLSELPDLPALALEALQSLGITETNQLLEVNIAETALQCGVEVGVLEGWVNTAARWLTVEDTPHG